MCYFMVISWVPQLEATSSIGHMATAVRCFVSPRSLIKTILAGSGTLSQGNELETVGVKVSDYNLNNLAGPTTKLYDLAGQIDYYGLHQLFMTDEAVYVLTWDASKFLRHKEVTLREIAIERWWKALFPGGATLDILRPLPPKLSHLVYYCFEK